MNLWQTTAADKMSNFINDFMPTSEVCFVGSFLEPTFDTIDIDTSDTFML